jgi:hypothetical protein
MRGSHLLVTTDKTEGLNRQLYLLPCPIPRWTLVTTMVEDDG